jgi:hypothetical protein
MRDIERIAIHLQSGVAVAAITGLDRDADTRVFTMTTFATLGTQRLSRLGKPRFIEAKGWMSIERTLMTRQAISVLHVSFTEIDRLTAIPEQVSRIGLELLSNRAWSGPVASVAAERRMTRIHLAWRRQVFFAWSEQHPQRTNAQKTAD